MFRRVPTAISQFTQFVNLWADGSISVGAWRMWMMAVTALLLGDHLGVWELHELFANNSIDVHEIGVIVAGLGALFSSLPKENGS